MPTNILGGGQHRNIPFRPGRKRWFLSPPEVACWSLDPVGLTMEMKGSMAEIGREKSEKKLGDLKMENGWKMVGTFLFARISLKYMILDSQLI